MTDDPLLGTEVGRYRLVRVLGTGGMGRVYEGVQPALGARVAIKILSEEAAGRPELVERFFAEAKAVNLIRHEAIAGVIDLLHLPSGRPVIVMELVEGRTLRDVLRAGAPPLGGLVQVMIEVLSALAAAHAKGIIHRDLKPDNIMITASGRAKVLDFGIAKLAANLVTATPRTQTGSVLGTPPYMSPEQISGATLDARSDVYTAGVVIYECVTGRVPFEGSDFDVMRAHLERRPTSPRALRPELPVPLTDVILCALAKEPRDRFASAAAMANALHGASAELPAGEWRSLGADGRMFPRSPAAPLPVPREPDPGQSLSGPTRSDRPSRPQVDGATRVERPSQPRVDGATCVERPTPQQPAPADRSSRSTVKRTWLRIAVPVVAACAGGAVVAGVFAMRREPQARPVPIDARALDAQVIAVAPRDATSAFTGLRPDYDPAHFDPLAYASRAREHARDVYSDAELVSMAFTGILPAGADSASSVVYLFRSPSRSQGADPQCLVTVIASTTLQIGAVSTPRCDMPVIDVRCDWAGLWQRAVAAGIDPAQRARFIASQGFLEMFGQQKGGGEKEVSLDCSPPAPVDAGARMAPRDARPRDAEPVKHLDPSAYTRTATQVKLPIDGYDPRHFDPSAYLAKAAQHGDELTAGGKVYELRASHVRPDGTVDLIGTERTYGSDVKIGVFGTKDPCAVSVLPTKDWVVVWKEPAPACGETVPHRPRCTLSQVWAKAAASGHMGHLQTAYMRYEAGAWAVESESEGDLHVEDRCP